MSLRLYKEDDLILRKPPGKSTGATVEAIVGIRDPYVSLSFSDAQFTRYTLELGGADLRDLYAAVIDNPELRDELFLQLATRQEPRSAVLKYIARVDAENDRNRTSQDLSDHPSADPH